MASEGIKALSRPSRSGIERDEEDIAPAERDVPVWDDFDDFEIDDAEGPAAKAANAPGLIVVWSADEAKAKVKVLAAAVPHAVERTNAAGEKQMMMPGLHYSGVEMMDAQELVSLMSGIAATGKLPSRLLGAPSMEESPRTVFQAAEEHAAAGRAPEPAKRDTFRGFRPPKAAPEPTHAVEAPPDAEKAEAKNSDRRTAMPCPPFCSWTHSASLAAK